MEPYWNQVEQIIRESDIVLEIIDARLVDFSRNEKIEQLIDKMGRPLIFVINKTDLIKKMSLEYSLDKLKQKGEVVYVSNRNKKSIKILISKIKQTFEKYGKRKDFTEPILAKPYREAKADVVIGIVGYPNVGKSSIINALAFKKKVKVSKTSGTTHGIHWIKAGDNIKLIDTPGVIPLEEHDEVRLGLIGARSPERLKEPDLVAARIIEMFLKYNKKDIEDFYGFEIGEETNPYLILEKLALHRHFLKKHGIADEMRASMLLIDDWQTGKLKL